MTGRLPTLILAMLIPALAYGASLPPIAFLSIGFREAKVADFAGTRGSMVRRKDREGFLSVTADFNDDGRADEARLLLNADRQIAYVVAVIRSSDKVDTYVLSEMPQRDAENIGIAPAARLSDEPRYRSVGLTIFALDSGSGEANYFDGEDFTKRVPASVLRPGTV